MSKTAHRIYISIMAGIVVVTTVFLAYKGYSYYTTPLEERFYHPDHENFKAAGLYGHGLGFVGTFLILFGVVMYIVRKRYKFFARWGRLKYWLEFHIFLCTLGPVMILFHTAFKFGGIVSIAFWSMVAVVISGVIGRYIYVQIPRSIEGRELSLSEIKESKTNIGLILSNNYQLDSTSQQGILAAIDVPSSSLGGNLMTRILQRSFDDRRKISQIKKTLRQNSLRWRDIRKVTKLVRNEIAINHRIERLQSMQQLFKYWHVAHLPFALVMLVIVVLHVAITLAFGYTWIF
ncbi:MAG: hypothetical protein KTR30_11740 [Saprospiraceae bacterium]|nr:hypothetical protein [Saprospiraceae bacterium]